MDYFAYHNGTLCAEDLPLNEIAKRFGTPTYVYSRATLERHFRAFDEAFAAIPHQVCYAVKANSNLAVLNVLARLGNVGTLVMIRMMAFILLCIGIEIMWTGWAELNGLG